MRMSTSVVEQSFQLTPGPQTPLGTPPEHAQLMRISSIYAYTFAISTTTDILSASNYIGAIAVSARMLQANRKHQVPCTLSCLLISNHWMSLKVQTLLQGCTVFPQHLKVPALKLGLLKEGCLHCALPKQPSV